MSLGLKQDEERSDGSEDEEWDKTVIKEGRKEGQGEGKRFSFETLMFFVSPTIQNPSSHTDMCSEPL